MSRRWLAERLRRWADEIDRDSAYCMFPAYFNYVQGKGRVLTETEGISTRQLELGCPLFYKADLYDLAWKELPPQ